MTRKTYQRPITILMLTLTIMIFGIISLTRLPITLMPSGSGNVISIITRYHGVSPEQIEKIVTIPIENAIGGIEGIKELFSISEEGKSRVNVYFYPGSDIEYGALKVREAVDTVAARFPKACQKPYVIKNDPEDKPVFIFNIKSKQVNLNDLREYAEQDLKKELSKIDGISEIDFSGGSLKEIHIDVNPAALVAYGIKITSISSLIQQAYYVNSQGKILEYNRNTNLYTDARFTSLKEIELLPVFFDRESGKNILLKDIARVYEGVREKENISRLNGEERVSLYIKKSGDANTLQVCQNILKFIDQNIDSSIKFEIIYNQGEYIEKAIGNVKNAALLGGIIAILVLFLFIHNFRAIFLISFSIPFSILLTFFCMFIMKVEINIMTLSGFALGIGMLLDNGIVMIEALSDDLSKGIWDQSEKVIYPILSSTLTTIAIFFPITFLNYDYRRLYGGLALTVTFSLISSVFCALIIIPAGYGIFYKMTQKIGEHKTKTSLYLEHKVMVFLKIIWKRSYLVFSLIILLLICIPFIVIKMDKEYIDPASGNEITAYVEMEAGTSLEETEKIVRRVEKVFKEDAAIFRVNSRIQKWHADIDLKYQASKFRSQEQFIQYLKTKTDGFKECFVHYEEKGASEGRIVDIDIIGDSDEELRQIAQKSSQIIRQVPGIRNVVLKFKEGKPSFTWQIDRDQCQHFQVPIAQAGEQLRWAIYGPVALKYIKDNKEMDLRVSYRDEDKKALTDVEGMLIYNGANETLYIKELGKFVKGREPGKIYRKNKRKTVRIGVYLGSLSLSKAIDQIRSAIDQVKLKDGYYFDFGDTLKKLKESQSVALLAIFLSIFIIYTILAIQFESFLLPAMILPVIPIAAGFAILVLFCLKMSLNLAVYIGIIILSGVVVNNTILITEGLKSAEVINLFSLYRVVKVRIKPVFITNATTILGLMPMIFQFGEGSELWRPLSITLCAGLLFGTFINLAAFPLLFLFKKNSIKNFLKNKKKLFF